MPCFYYIHILNIISNAFRFDAHKFSRVILCRPNMQTPCGKCSTCPCSGSKKEKRQADQPQQQSQSPSSPSNSPKVECLCVSRRQKSAQTSALQAPLADTYTCTRVRAEPAKQIPLEERCTCRIKATPAQCECAPPVQQQPSYRQMEDVMPPTHAQIACGQPIPNQRYNQSPQYTPSGPNRCGHCQSQQKKKKCTIQ